MEVWLGLAPSTYESTVRQGGRFVKVVDGRKSTSSRRTTGELSISILH